VASYVDLATLHVPAPRSKPPATWGLQVRENFEFLHDNRRQIVTSSTRPTAAEGREIYESDTDLVLVYDGTNWVRTARLGAPSTWTPTITQNGNVTKTVNVANYWKIGRRVYGELHVTCTGAGGSSVAIQVSMPDTMVYSGTPSIAVGVGGVFDASAAVFYTGMVVPISSTTLGVWGYAETNVAGADPAFTLANTDQITMSFAYYSTTV